MSDAAPVVPLAPPKDSLVGKKIIVFDKAINPKTGRPFTHRGVCSEETADHVKFRDEVSGEIKIFPKTFEMREVRF